MKTKSTEKISSEDAECVLLVQYLDELKRTGKIKAYTHIPNNTFTPSWHAKLKNKAMGLMPGFPDYVVVTPRQVVCIEMKRVKGGVVSPAQKVWLDALNSAGVVSAVCQGFEAAELFMENVLNNVFTPTRGLGATEQDRAMLQDLDGFSGSRIGAESEIAHNRPEREDEAA